MGLSVSRAEDAQPGSDKQVLELLLGGQQQYQMYYMSTCGAQLEQFKREYPSVPKEFWDEYSGELEGDWIKSTISTMKSRLTEEQYREVAKFAASPAGRALVQEKLMMMKDVQSASKQLGRDRFTKLQLILQDKGYKKAVSSQNCVYNLRLIDQAKEQCAMAKSLKRGDAVPADQISQYIKGGVDSLTCPEGGKYTINAVGEAPVCSAKDHKLN